MLARLFGKHKEAKPPEPELYITSVEAKSAGWFISYEGGGEKYESFVCRKAHTGYVRSAPQPGAKVERHWWKGMGHIPPILWLHIGNENYRHFSTPTAIEYPFP